MAQGKEYTQEQRENILESIKPYLQMGYSLNKACILAEQDPSVVYKWCDKDDSLAKKIASWRNMVTAIARQNLINTIRGKKDEKTGEWIDKPDIDNAKWWLERKAKDEFGRNLDITSDGEAIRSNIVQFVEFDKEQEEEEVKEQEKDYEAEGQ